jgi:hypothetical protein
LVLIYLYSSLTSKTQLRGEVFRKLLVYYLPPSFLVFRRSKGKGAGLSAVRRVTGFDRCRTLPRIRRRLTDLGLVEIRDGRLWAKEPDADRRGWFAWVRGQEEGDWWERLAYWWLYLPAKGLTLKQAGVWSMLLSFTSAGRRVRRSGLPALLKVDAKTVRVGLGVLEDLGLCGGLVPREPGPEQEKLFRPKKSATYKPSRGWSFPDELEPELKDRLCPSRPGGATRRGEGGRFPGRRLE